EGGQTFTDVVYKTAGSQTLKVADVANAAVCGSANAAVASAAVNKFQSAIPVNATAGTPFNVTVVAVDAYNNPVTGYNGTIHFTSSDPQGVLPPDTPLSNGSGSFTVTLKTEGNQNFVVQDTLNRALTGTSGP